MREQMFGVPERFIPPEALPPSIAKRLERLRLVGGGAYIDPRDLSLRCIDGDRFGQRVELQHYRWDNATRLYFPYVNHNGTWKAQLCSAVPWRWYAAQNPDETLHLGDWADVQADLKAHMLLRRPRWPLAEPECQPVWAPIGSGLSLPALETVMLDIVAGHESVHPAKWVKFANDLLIKYGNVFKCS